MALPSSGALEGARTITEYRATGHVPERLTPQRAQALERIGERQGLIRELAIIADVSDGVIRGLVKAGAIEAVEVDDRRPLPRRPIPISTPPALDADAAAAAAEPARRGRCRRGFAPFLLDGVTGSGKTEVYFEAIAEAIRDGQADARPAPRDRADRALPEALRRPLRLRPGRLAFGPAPVAAPPRLAGDRQRRGAGRGRRALGAVPALSQARPDRRRRGARDQLQAGGRRPLSRPRRRGDARASSRRSRSILASATPAIETRHMAEIGSYSELKLPDRFGGARAARHRGDRPDRRPAAARPLAGAEPGRASSRTTRARASRACCSSTAAATPRSRCAATAAIASNAPIAPPGWSSTA